jgi:single-stranded-DNA-specific exonuclease
LVASRLTETYYRPSIVGAYEEEFTRASCRSIPEFHITHALDECADLMVRHGGHAMAAGFTVRNDNLPKLIERLQTIAVRELADRDLRPVLRADMEISLSDLRYVDLREINRLEPCGLANPSVTFVSRNLNVGKYRRVGKENQHLKLTVNDGKVTIDAIAFRQGDLADEMYEQVDLLYAYEKNEYRGIETMQLNVRDIKRSRRRD